MAFDLFKILICFKISFRSTWWKVKLDLELSFCFIAWILGCFWYLRKAFKTGSLILHKNIHLNYDLESLDFLFYLKRQHQKLQLYSYPRLISLPLISLIFSFAIVVLFGKASLIFVVAYFLFIQRTIVIPITPSCKFHRGIPLLFIVLLIFFRPVIWNISQFCSQHNRF